MAVGLFGAVGAFIGAHIAAIIPGHQLKWMTAGMLFFSAFLLWVRVFYSKGSLPHTEREPVSTGLKFWMNAGGLGIVTGILSGTFGIGATPFIQIGLLILFSLSIHQAAGTTMLVILPIALLGGVGYLAVGNLDMGLLLKVTVGLMAGAYTGAKFTKRLHPLILKTAMVAIPIFGGLMLSFGP
jgi:uncharacterized membrane protein YfcA